MQCEPRADFVGRLGLCSVVQQTSIFQTMKALLKVHFLQVLNYFIGRCVLAVHKEGSIAEMWQGNEAFAGADEVHLPSFRVANE